MVGIPSVRVKAFLVDRVGGDGVGKATIEFADNPRFLRLPQEAREVLADTVPAELLKLTMPDGSEWLVEDETLEFVLQSVRESRAHFAAASGA